MASELCDTCAKLNITQVAHNTSYRHPTKGVIPAQCWWHRQGNKHPKEIELEKEKKAEALHTVVNDVDVEKADTEPELSIADVIIPPSKNPVNAYRCKNATVANPHGAVVKAGYCSLCWSNIIKQGVRHKKTKAAPERLRPVESEVPTESASQSAHPIFDVELLDTLFAQLSSDEYVHIAKQLWKVTKAIDKLAAIKAIVISRNSNERTSNN